MRLRPFSSTPIGSNTLKKATRWRAAFRVAAIGSVCALVAGSALAQSSVSGDVRGTDGRMAKAAEVRLQRQDQKQPPVVVKTDAAGRFAAKNLPPGTYTITTQTANATSPLKTIQLHAGRSVAISFDLRNSGQATTASAKKKKKYVWVPAETGSNGGRYVEVDDDNAPVTHQSGDPMLQKMDGSVLQHMPTYRSRTGGGH